MGKWQSRRGNKASLPNPLSNGEFGWANDTEQLYIGTGVSNNNIFIGGSAATADYTIYVYSGGDTVANGATGLVLVSVAADDVGGTTDSTNIYAGSSDPFTSANSNGFAVYNATRDKWSIATYVAAGHLTCSPAITSQVAGDQIIISNAIDNFSDAYGEVPTSYGVNVTIRMADETFTYPTNSTFSGKSPLGAVALTLAGSTTGTTNLESTTTGTITFGDALTLTNITFPDHVIYSDVTTATSCPITGNMTTNAAVTLTTSDITGNVISNSAITLNNTDISGTLTANDNFTNTTDITVTGAATIAGTATLATATFSDALTTNGTCTNTTSLDISGNWVSAGASTAVDVSVGGNLTISDTFISTTDLDVTGDITTTASTTVAGSVTCDNITTSVGVFTQTGSINISTNATFNAGAVIDTVTIGGTLVSNGTLTQTTSMGITGSWTSAGPTTAVDVNVGVDLVISDTFVSTTDLDVTGDITTTAQATVAGTVTCDNITTSVGVFTQTGSLDVTTDATFSANAIIDTVTIGGNLTTNADLTQTTSMGITGTWDAYGTSTAVDLTQTGDSDFSGSLTLTGTSTFNGEVSIRDAHTVTGATFTKRVFEYFGANIDWTTCVTSGDDGFIITKSTAIANTFRSTSNVVFESDPGLFENISSTVTVGYSIYTATPALGGSDANNDGLMITQGTGTSTSANKLVDSTANFTTAKHDGMTVWNSTDETWAEVTAVDSTTQLSLDNDIMASGESYKLVAARSTVQGGINQVPGTVNCDTNIRISNGTFSEDPLIQGRAYSGAYSIFLRGTLTLQVTEASATVSAGTGATQGTVTAASGTPFGSYDQKLVYFVTDDAYRMIDSDTTTVLTLVSVAPSSTTQDVKIYDWGTILDGTAESLKLDTQKNIKVYNCKFEIGTIWSVNVNAYSSCTFYNCWFLTGTILSNDYSAVRADTCLMDTTTTSWAGGAYVAGGATFTAFRTKIVDCVGFGVNILQRSSITIQEGTRIDNCTTGIRVGSNSVAAFGNSASLGYTTILNNTDGVYAFRGGQGQDTLNVVYSGNTSDETAISASYGYVD